MNGFREELVFEGSKLTFKRRRMPILAHFSTCLPAAEWKRRAEPINRLRPRFHVNSWRKLISKKSLCYLFDGR